jgi:hypothetical protein
MQRTAFIIVYLGLLFCGVCVCSTSLQAQAPARPSSGSAKQTAEGQPGFLPGYALHGTDTIQCMLGFNHSFPYPGRVEQITLDLQGEIMTFDAADGLITGFGVIEAGKLFEYGLIIDGFNGRKKTGYFAKKLVAGSIDLYEQQVNTRLNRPGAQNNGNANTQSGRMPGSGNSIQSTEKRYFVGKYNASDSSFINPIKLQALRKEYLAPFISDYPELLEDVPKKFNRKYLMRIIEDYNYWKRKQQR